MFTSPHELLNGTMFNLVHPHFHLQIPVISKVVQSSCLNVHLVLTQCT